MNSPHSAWMRIFLFNKNAFKICGVIFMNPKFKEYYINLLKKYQKVLTKS